MKNFAKILTGLVLGLVVFASMSVEAKALTMEEYQVLAYYAANGGNMNALPGNYSEQYKDYAKAYTEYVTKATQMQAAAAYLGSHEMYENPKEYYYYANFVTDGAFGRANGSSSEFEAKVNKYVKEYQKHLAVMKQYSYVMDQVNMLQNVYALGEKYKSYSGGKNPYSNSISASVQVYADWVKANSKYIY